MRSNAASALESSGPTTRIRSKPAVGGRPANVSSKRSRSRFRSSHSSAPTPLRGLSDQLEATTLIFLPASGSRLAGGWKSAGSTAFGMTTGSRSAKPSSRCFASENSD